MLAVGQRQFQRQLWLQLQRRTFTAADFDDTPSKPLSGVTICICSGTGGGSTEELSYREILDLTYETGAKCRRSPYKPHVYCLVSTETAVKKAVKTSKTICRALRHDRPIVKVDWLRACLKEERQVPLDDYKFDSDALRKKLGIKTIDEESKVLDYDSMVRAGLM